jgi:protein TonB
VNLELVEREMPKPRPPKPRPEPVVTVEEPRPDKPPPAPKAGRVVLPDEAFEQAPAPQAEIKLDRPSLREDVVVKKSEVEAPVIVSGEIFGRADELVPAEPGVFGLGGTGTAVDLGPFGTEREGEGTGTQDAPAPVAPVPEAPKPKGPSRPPRVVNWTDPPYPEQARQQGIEGTVILKLSVTAKGSPRNVAVVKSSGHSGLDEAAVAHVQKTGFSPALKDGQPVAMTITFRVKFRLVNA